MSTQTALFQVPDVSAELKKFGVQDAAIAEMSRQYLPLTINGINDKDGADAVQKAKMIVIKARTSTEKVRVALKADALKFGKAVDAEANRIFKLIEPIENHLKEEQARIELEAEAIRNAARLKEEAERRTAEEAERAKVKAAQDAENARLAAERAELAKQREALEAERKKAVEAAAAEKAKQDEEYAAERQRIAVERAAIQVAQDKIDAANRAAEEERQRLADLEIDRLRKIEVARLEAEEAESARVLKEKLDRIMAEEADAARLRAEELRPDATKREPNPNCEICGGTGENRDAVQAWDIPGAPIPDCPCTKQTFLQEDADKLLAVASIVRGIAVPMMARNESMASAARVGQILDRAAAEIRDTAIWLAKRQPEVEGDSIPF